MKAAAIVAAMLAAAPVVAQTCAPVATVPGFAPGQAAMADRLTVGRPAELALTAVDSVGQASARARPPVAGSFGGVFPLTITVSGTYRIALSGKAWIDVAQDGAPLVATGHEHGVACSGVAKIVVFQLEPGRYEVRLSEAVASTITVKVMHEAVIPIAR